MNEPRPRSAWSIASAQWQGARPYQEDDYGYDEVEFGTAGETPAVLMVLADGMGGEAGGATASRCVVDTFMRHIREPMGGTETRLDECLDAANREIQARMDADPDLEGMGSTVVAAVYDGRSLWWRSVGDSPMWLFTGGRLVRLNADHSMAPVLDRMAEVGELTHEEALSNGTRHMLRSAMTGSELDLVDRGHEPCRLAEGDYLLLASDGIDTLSPEEIEQCIGATRGGARETADALLSAVKAAARPHQDNVTLLLLAGEGRAAQSAERSSRATARAPRPFRRQADRSVVVALFLGVGLLLVALILWGLQGTSEILPESGTSASSGAPAESVAEDSSAPSAEESPGKGSPESTGGDESAADSDQEAEPSGARAGDSISEEPSTDGQ